MIHQQHIRRNGKPIRIRRDRDLKSIINNERNIPQLFDELFSLVLDLSGTDIWLNNTLYRNMCKVSADLYVGIQFANIIIYNKKEIQLIQQTGTNAVVTTYNLTGEKLCRKINNFYVRTLFSNIISSLKRA